MSCTRRNIDKRKLDKILLAVNESLVSRILSLKSLPAYGLIGTVITISIIGICAGIATMTIGNLMEGDGGIPGLTEEIEKRNQKHDSLRAASIQEYQDLIRQNSIPLSTLRPAQGDVELVQQN